MGDIDTAYIYLHTIEEEAIHKLLKKGYDVEIGGFVFANDEFEVRISCKKKEKGNYFNPIEDFHKLADEGRIVVVEKEEGIEVNIPGKESYFFESYEDLFCQSACSNVKRLIDKVVT
ncbi:MAG: hypothetical protein ACI4F4_06565 [Lachnospiraceae bacterium]